MSDATIAASGVEALLLRAEVEQLLFAEAELLDARDFDAWLALFAEDATYWIPSNSDELDPQRQVSIVYERHAQLAERVWRLSSGLAYAQEPHSRSAHLVGNVRVLDSGDPIHVSSTFVVVEYRREQIRTWAGRYRHELRRGDGGLEIVLKKVELIDNDGHLGNLSLIL